MTIDLYYMPGSAPCRAVRLTAKALGVPVNLIQCNLMAGEHMKPEYLKMNPQHTIPTINDNGFSLWESRAILQYLAEKYGKNDALYPKDPAKRAVVNQRLYFDMGTLYHRFGDLYYPMMFGGVTTKDPEKVKKLDEALAFFETFLSNSKFAAGDSMTIADHSLMATVSTIDAVSHDLSRYPNVTRWYAECKKVMDGYDEENGQGAKEFGDWFKSVVKTA
ncbi:Glutathione S-transferase D1 [Frankliniella fusca]|uniref:Glutathione S-transferase D1 n=2 Tax=Arthropoda TaxID=6656 RepID=A0AAE1H404_9NEOP|nr:Glutathione S-transferase D1 [Frankliniella fusca]